MDSLIRSTLECFYNDTDCFQVILNTTYSISKMIRPWPSATVHPLVHDTSLTQFPPNTSLSLIVKQMMIEEWNDTFSFDRYYKTCLPKHCAYSFTKRAKDSVGIVLLLVSSIGGLTEILLLITPLIVKFIFRLLQRKPKNPRRRGNSIEIALNFHLTSTYVSLSAPSARRSA
jgi:hypothetical protein